MEGKISEQMEFLQELIDVIPTPVFYKDTEGKYIGCNTAFIDALGFSKDDIVGKTEYDVASNELADVYRRADAHLLAHGGVQVYESQVRYTDSILHDVLFHKTVFRDIRGEVAGIIGVILDITDLKKAHEAIRESEEVLKNVGRVAKVGGWELDMENKEVRWTEETYRIHEVPLGYEPSLEEAINFFHPEDRPRLEAAIHRALDYGEPYDMELRFITAKGKELWTHTICRPYVKEGRIIKLTGTFHDITDLKKAHSALEESERKYRNLVENLNEGIWVIDAEGYTTYVNPSMAWMLGYTPEEVLGVSVFRFMDDERAEEVRNHLRRRAEGVPEVLEMEFIRKDGQKVYVLLNTSPIFNDEGELSGAMASVTDVTGRRIYEEALRESEEKFRNFFESSKDVIYITDIDGTVIDINPAVEDLYGYGRDDLIGQRVGPVYSNPEDREKFQDQITRDGFVKDFEVVYKDASGESHYCLETATIRRDASGNIIGYQGFIRDNTERMYMQEQLIQAEKLSSLGGILSGVAHELNNPLTSIIGNAQLLTRKPITGEIKEKLDVIQRESLRCTKIVGGLLAFAREHKPERSMKDINEVIKESCKLREYELRVDDITLTTDLEERIPETSIDPYQIQQVFINLINNAHHALIDVGGGSLEITSRCEGDAIVVDFIDNGPGIPEDIRRKIFDPFFTTKETGKGTGLGLSVCYGIVNEHGGTIEVKSVPGEETCFSVILPIGTEEVSEEVGLKADVIPKPQGKVTVLVIEDEESLRNFVASALELEGYVVCSCESADRAVEIVGTKEFDIIVSDMKMPGMSGQNFYTYVQKHIPTLIDRIVFITGDVLGSETQNFFKITGCRYIEKPFEIDDLMMVLGELLDETTGAG
jgi:two-component system NtrC family sensor kinase